MKAARSYHTEAIVLRHFDYGEADRVLTLYTPHHGRLRAIAKGVRRISSRRAGHLELFTRCGLQLARGRAFEVISQAQAIEHFPNLRLDLMRFSRAHYLTELVDAFTPEHLPNPRLYATSLAYLRRLDQTDSPLVLRAFEMSLLDQSGYRPQLTTCLGCGKAIIPEPNHFSVELGGALCPSCQTMDPAAQPITIPALKLLRNLQTNVEAVLRLTSVEAVLLTELEERLREYIVYRLERRPKSVAVLESLAHTYSAVGA
ncbi:MAG TPA: DNA repair protein RecO [Chloroflexota bacterium]|nr:DNA repair protein RecO [Chloroflexota bacterium]